MRVLCLPVVAELGHGLVLALGDEDRVEAEARFASRLGGDPAFERAGAASLFIVRAECDELADVARASRAALHPLELPQHPADLVAGGAAGRVDSGAAAEAGHLDPGVLPEHPELG